MAIRFIQLSTAFRLQLNVPAPEPQPLRLLMAVEARKLRYFSQQRAEIKNRALVLVKLRVPSDKHCADVGKRQKATHSGENQNLEKGSVIKPPALMGKLRHRSRK